MVHGQPKLVPQPVLELELDPVLVPMAGMLD